jgi:hypothetical protein
VGLFKQLKDAKDVMNAAPGMMAQAQQMAAQAQQMAAAQQAAAQAQMAAHAGGAPAAQGTIDPVGPDFEPIAGVALDQFAAVSKGVAAYNYDASKLVEIAASRGIPAQAWAEAHQGWNDRIKANPAVAKRFNQLYRES